MYPRCNIQRDPNLKRKYTVRFDILRKKWLLKHDVSEKVLRVFATKEEATRAGALRKAIGRQGGLVTIRSLTGAYEEERTFPNSDDR